jgi:hypothetical protein
METPANDRGRFLYLYFQCSEVERVKRHVSEETFSRGSKLKPAAVRDRHEIWRCRKADLCGLLDLLMSALAI